MQRIFFYFTFSAVLLLEAFTKKVNAQQNIQEILIGTNSAWAIFLKAFQQDPKKIKHPADIIVGILNIILGFLGLFMVCLLIYAGFLYMTAGGDEKKTTAAKGYIKNSIIGLALVLASFAITWFVAKAFTGLLL